MSIDELYFRLTKTIEKEFRCDNIDLRGDRLRFCGQQLP
jgi:hypothetical protein